MIPWWKTSSIRVSNTFFDSVQPFDPVILSIPSHRPHRSTHFVLAIQSGYRETPLESSSVLNNFSGPNDIGSSCSKVMTTDLPSLSYIRIGVCCWTNDKHHISTS